MSYNYLKTKSIFFILLLKPLLLIQHFVLFRFAVRISDSRITTVIFRHCHQAGPLKTIKKFKFFTTLLHYEIYTTFSFGCLEVFLRVLLVKINLKFMKILHTKIHFFFIFQQLHIFFIFCFCTFYQALQNFWGCDPLTSLLELFAFLSFISSESKNISFTCFTTFPTLGLSF